MPAITDLPIRTERGYEYFSQGTATTTPATYTYPGTMTNYIFRNDGSVNVTLTVNGLATTVASGDCAIGTGMASFTVTASSGTISWTMRAFDLIGVPMLQGGVDQTSALKSYTLQTAATATGNGTVADVSGYATFVATVVISGTATITWEASSDITFPANLTSTILARPSGSSGNATTTAAVTGIFILNVSGIKYIRARISAYSSGTVDVTATATTGATIWYPTTSGFGGSDALAASSLLQGAGSFNLLFNGSTWDRVRNNLSNSTLSSAARTSTTNSADQNNFNHRGAIFFLNVTAASGTGGLQLVVQVKDNIESSNYKTITTTPTAVTAIGQYVYVIYPSADNVNGAVQQVASQPLPRSFRVQVIHGDASSYTYTVAQQLIL